MQHKIITTEDGSHTLFVPELSEHYHSVNGAIQESKHVFIDTGFKYFLEKNINQDDQKSINILEIGFGTGLNAFLTLIESQKLNVNVFYQSVELYPVSIKEAEKLNYFELINQSEQKKFKQQTNLSESEHFKVIDKTLFMKLHTTPWERAVDILPGFTLLKQKFDFSKCEKIRADRLFNLIYFDAFAPDKQPEMWTEDIFGKIYSLSDADAVFTTYCAKGVVRRMLQSAGFKMERLPGPPGKREILRGSKLLIFDTE